MSWKDLKIWMKLMVVFGACFIIYIGTTIWNNRVLQAINAEKGMFYTDQALMGKTMAALNENYHHFSLATINFQYNGKQDAFFGARAQFEGALKAIVKNTAYRNETLKKDLGTQLEAIAKTAANMNAGNLQQGLDEIGAQIQLTHGNAVKMLEKEQQRIDNVVESQKRTIIYVQLSTLVVFVLLFLILVITIEKANKATLNFSRRLSVGELSIDFGHIARDEFGQINQSLFELQARMRVIVEHINETMAGVKKASAEFFSSSQLISDGANNQAATSNEISSTIDQIAIIAQQTTESALQTSDIAKNAFLGIQKGAHDVSDTFHTIEEIALKNSIISEISYQTKILSINASVEAARASEFGKGFGVIADQVKNLAEDSQKSATEIESVSRRGVNLTRELAEQLNLLVEEFQKTSDLIVEVADSGKEQYEAIQQVAMAVQDLNNITQQNASSSEELAASSEQLVNLSGELEKTLAFFRLDEVSQQIEEIDARNPADEKHYRSDEQDDETDDSAVNTPKGSGFFMLRKSISETDDHFSQEEDDVDESEAQSMAFGQNVQWDDTSEEEEEEKPGWFSRIFPRKKQAETSFDDDFTKLMGSEKDEQRDQNNDGLTPDEIDENLWPKQKEDSELVAKMNEDKTSGVRINLADNDELDNQFRKMK